MIPFSVLDLSPILAGGTAADAFHNSLDLAQHAERLGFHRYWLAEHHNMPGIASAATSVVIGHVAAGTSTIRVGAGGVMLPNHSPLVIAEQFGTLESLHPGRIDLAVGRAPGTDQRTAFALRRDAPTAAERFPQDVVELLHYFQPVQANQPVRAYPGAGLQVPVWILGIEPVRCTARGNARPPVRLRIAFRAGDAARRAEDLPLQFPENGFHRAADCHGGYWRLRGRHGARGAASSSRRCSSNS